MPIEHAIWHPFWYELDQSVEAGQVDCFEFFRRPPHDFANDDVLVFYCGNWNDSSRYFTAKKRILKIHHPQIGSIQRIDARDLDYTFTLLDGTILKVEAEQCPGVVHGFRTPVKDWRVFVEMESA